MEKHRLRGRIPHHPARSVWFRPATGGSQGGQPHANGLWRERVDHPNGRPRVGNPSIRWLAGASRPGRRPRRSLARRRCVYGRSPCKFCDAANAVGPSRRTQHIRKYRRWGSFDTPGLRRVGATRLRGH